MTRDRVIDPGGSGARVEALTIGVRPAGWLVTAAIATTTTILVSVGGFWVWINEIKRETNQQLSLIQWSVVQNSTDRWTYSQQVSFCRKIEMLNKSIDFKCPPVLERFKVPPNPFKLGQSEK